jgi:hypothetical protein
LLLPLIFLLILFCTNLNNDTTSILYAMKLLLSSSSF